MSFTLNIKNINKVATTSKTKKKATSDTVNTEEDTILFSVRDVLEFEVPTKELIAEENPHGDAFARIGLACSFLRAQDDMFAHIIACMSPIESLMKEYTNASEEEREELDKMLLVEQIKMKSYVKEIFLDTPLFNKTGGVEKVVVPGSSAELSYSHPGIEGILYKIVSAKSLIDFFSDYNEHGIDSVLKHIAEARAKLQKYRQANGAEQKQFHELSFDLLGLSEISDYWERQQELEKRKYAEEERERQKQIEADKWKVKKLRANSAKKRTKEDIANSVCAVNYQPNKEEIAAHLSYIGESAEQCLSIVNSEIKSNPKRSVKNQANSSRERIYKIIHESDPKKQEEE